MTVKGDGASSTATFECTEPSRKVIPSGKPQHVAVLCPCIGSIPDVRLSRCVLCFGMHPSRVGLVCGEQFPTGIAVKFNEMLLGHFVLDTSLHRRSHWAGFS